MWTKERLGYLLLLAAIIAVAILISHDFLVAVMMTSFIFGQPIYEALKKSDKLIWMLPCALLMGTGLGLLYYVGNLSVFPHELTTSHHIRSAAVTGIGAAVLGVLGTWIKESKGLPMLKDVPVKTQEKR